MLVVLAGRPGTGKTTLSRLVAGRLGAALLRVDAVEAVVVRCGLAEPPVGVVGYAVAHEVAASTLRVGTPVVVDAVNPVPQARSGWRGLAAEAGARLVVVELTTSDVAEHRRRVEARVSDLDGLTVPTWQEASEGGYVPWDEERDGPRLLLDTSDGVERLVAQVLEACARP